MDMMCSNAVHTATAERRSDVRINFGAGLNRIPVLVGAIVEEAVVRDISRQGIGLLLSQEVKPGQFIIMQIFNHAWQRGHLKTTRVMHAMPSNDGHWIVGCSLLQPFTEDELHAVIGETDGVHPEAVVQV